MGPYRMETLRAQRHEERARRAADIRARKHAENQERTPRLQWTQRWQERPHSRSPTPRWTVPTATPNAVLRREQASPHKARRELAAREPDVMAGYGSRGTDSTPACTSSV